MTSTRKICLFLIILIIVCPLCFAGVGDIIPIGDVFYDQIDALAVISGLSTPNTARPWSVSQAQLELDRLSSHGAGGKLLGTLQDRLDELKEDSLKVGLSFSPEMYIHTNTDEFILESDWVHGFADRKQFAVIDLTASIKGFSTYCEISYGWGKTTWKDTESAVTMADYAEQEAESWTGLGADIPASEGTNIMLFTKSWLYSKNFVFSFPDMDKIEIEMPRRTYISYATDHFSMSFSRDRLSWGSSNIGNFIFSDSVERQNYISIKAFAKNYGFDYVLMIPEFCYGNEASSDLTLHRLFLAHRFYARPFEKLWIEASENVMYSPETFDLGSLNPSFIFHQNTRSKEFNAIAHVQLQFVPFDGFEIWAQYCLDQAQAPTESDSQDDAWGLSGGVGYSFVLKDRGVVGMSLEGAYTTPAMYRRNYVDFILWTRYSTNHGTKESGIGYMHYPFFHYLGFPYGGDCIAVMAKADYLDFNGMKLTLTGQLLIHGGFGMFDIHNRDNDVTGDPNQRLSTPSEGGSRIGYVDLAFTWPLDVMVWKVPTALEMNADIAVAFKESCSPDLQMSFGITASI